MTKKEGKRAIVKTVNRPKMSMKSAPEDDTPPGVPAGLDRPVRSARSARRYLARILQAYQRGQIDATNAKTSVYILSEFLRAVEVSDFEQKIIDLEGAIKKEESER